MILVFTGNGKGKTTAAIGQGVRALGQGKRVFMIQFIKSHGYPSGEDEILPKKFGEQFTFVKGGKGFVGIMGDKLPRSDHEEAARQTLQQAKEAINSKEFGLVILDEVNVALKLDLISKDDILEIISNTPKEIDLILTGRDACSEVINQADLVTDFQDKKHPFEGGTSAKKGIEY